MRSERRKGEPVGKVWLVGAGPGDPGLLTLKGREVLERAKVIVIISFAAAYPKYNG